MDIKHAMEELGHIVQLFEESHKDKADEQACVLTEAVSEADVVFSVNFFPRVSDVCARVGRKYISWTVDSPLIAMYHEAVFHECNYIFLFDKFSYVQFRQMGVKHVYYLALAVDTNRLDCLVAQAPQSKKELFTSDISFVGGLYHKNSYDKIYERLPEYLKGYFDAAMQAQLDWFGENIFDRMLTVDILEQLAQIVDFKQDERSFSDLKLVFTSTFLGYKMAHFERITCLNELAKRFQTDLYTDEPDDELQRVNIRGSVQYDTDMPLVFNGSKINMNFTIRNIRTGIPLRVWDILGAGGFLLTNFQAELPMYFENEKHIVYYESVSDMLRKAEYYLSHEDERCCIAEAGHRLVKEHHSYKQRLQEIFHIVENDA